MSLKKLLKKLHTPKWLFVLLLIVLILRIPSLFEPYSYGDEMIYLSLGEAIRRGIPLYKGIHDNKPPLLYILAAISGNLFWFKSVLAIWNIITIFLFWKLATKIFPNKFKLQKIATIIFGLLTTLPLLEGNIANAELFLIGPIIGAFLLLWPFTKKSTPKKIIFAGLLFSMATLFKVPGMFDMGAIVFAWFVASKSNFKSIIETAIKTFYLLLGFLTPILISLAWFGLQGALSEYLIAAFGQNIGYLSSWRPTGMQESFLVRNAPLLIRSAILFCGLLVLYIKRNRLSKPFIFTVAWLGFTLFAVTLSERPYPHYLIQSVAPVSLLLGMLLTQKIKEQVYTIVPLAIAFFVPFYFNFWYYPTTPYYVRFVKFATKQITKEEYFSLFDEHVLTNYKLADYISAATRPDEKVFIWGDGSVIYALSRRFPPGKYVANYHIRDFSSNRETIEILSSDFPKLIVVHSDESTFPELTMFLRENYILVDNIDGAEVWSVLSARVRALITH